MRNVINAQKDDVFRIRMNSEVLNTGGFPFSVTEDNAEKMKAKALSKLMKELEIGMNCTESYSEEEAKKMLGL